MVLPKIYTNCCNFVSDGAIAQRAGLSIQPREIPANSDTNNLTEEGFYIAGYGNGCSNLPDNESGRPADYGFGLIVTKGGGMTQQLLLPRANPASFNATRPFYRVYEDYIQNWTIWNVL